MKKIIEQLLADDLSALSGLRVKGKFPVRQEVANRLIGALLEKFRAEGSDGAPEAGGGETPSSRPKTDSGGSLPLDDIPAPQTLLQYIRTFAVEMREGVVILHLEIEVED